MNAFTRNSRKLLNINNLQNYFKTYLFCIELIAIKTTLLFLSIILSMQPFSICNLTFK